MNSGQSLFAQLMEHAPGHEFRKCVERYAGNHRVKSFSCWDQFLCMTFAQLTFRESLRDIVACLRSQDRRLYHMGIRGTVSRSTLADANETRDWRASMRILRKFSSRRRERCTSTRPSGSSSPIRCTRWTRPRSTCA